MAKYLSGVTALSASTITHEGAAAFDLSKENPLMHLVFTKGATVFCRSFYRRQSEEIFYYSKALIDAERHEEGFAWKFAAYMRDPKKGKGNRIQGTVAPAILSAAFPDSPYIEEYVFRCLRHRADDLILFICHFANLGLGDIPESAKQGLARAANQFDEYQLLKYATRRFPLSRRRKGGKRASLRLADALGVAKAYLNEEIQALYQYLHAPTRLKDAKAEGLQLAAARRRYFKGGTTSDAAQGRVTVEQVLSTRGCNQKAWTTILEIPGLFPDIAFKQYLRSMYCAGMPLARLRQEVEKRKFTGLWPHQVYAGFAAAKQGSARTGLRGQVRFQRKPCPQIEIVFDDILSRVAGRLLPPGLNLGIADISGSMYSTLLAGEHSTVTAGDAAVLFSAMMSKDLGYAATFSSKIDILKRCGTESDLHFADRIRRDGRGGGSTQVAGAVATLIMHLLENPQAARPRTLYFFSDMQFQPPNQHMISDHIKDGCKLKLRRYFSQSMPPLRAAIWAYRELIGPVDVVLWNLAAYEAAPVPVDMPNVLMVSGFDANTFEMIGQWQCADKRPRRAQAAGASPPREKVGKAQNCEVELEHIRTF